MVVATAVAEGPATCQQMRRVASLVVAERAAGENGWERMEVEMRLIGWPTADVDICTVRPATHRAASAVLDSESRRR